MQSVIYSTMTITTHKTAPKNGIVPPYSFTGKERDEETGYSYFGARYYDSDLSGLFLSIDPMADKYPSISPYAYCAWNPVRLVDPNGDTLQLIGTEECKQKALQQMQYKSNNLRFTYDDRGIVTYEGNAQTKSEKYMEEILNSSDVSVLLDVQKNNNNPKGYISKGGAFYGNRLNESEDAVTTFQAINIITSEKYDKMCKKPGNMIWHEISESYEGGKISLATHKSASPAIIGLYNSVYETAHLKAGRFFPGTIVPDEAFRVTFFSGLNSEPKLQTLIFYNYRYERD